MGVYPQGWKLHGKKNIATFYDEECVYPKAAFF